MAVFTLLYFDRQIYRIGRGHMGQLNLKVSQQQLDGLREYAARKRRPVSWLIKDYIDYLLRGGAPVMASASAIPSAEELATLAQAGGSFDWLREEPEVYSSHDGESL
jgi:hypothetical protein